VRHTRYFSHDSKKPEPVRRPERPAAKTPAPGKTAAACSPVGHGAASAPAAIDYPLPRPGDLPPAPRHVQRLAAGAAILLGLCVLEAAVIATLSLDRHSLVACSAPAVADPKSDRLPMGPREPAP